MAGEHYDLGHILRRDRRVEPRRREVAVRLAAA